MNDSEDVADLPCKRWPRPNEPITVSDIMGNPYLTNGYFLPHLLNEEAFSITPLVVFFWDFPVAAASVISLLIQKVRNQDLTSS